MSEQIPGIRPLEETHPHMKEFTDLLPDLNNESDRGVALITTSFIDEYLKRAISGFLVQGKSERLLEGFNAPLGTFSSRIVMATALGVIRQEEGAEADRLRKIRNIFAHEIRVSFADEKVGNICRNLVFSAQDYADVKLTPRMKFMTSSAVVMVKLINRPYYVAMRRLKTVDWSD